MIDTHQLLRWIQRGRQSTGLPQALRRGVLAVWKAARLVPGAGVIRTTLRADGHRMTVRAFSYADLLSISDRYEADTLDWLPREGEVAVDAGAFIGRHTLAYARACGPSGRVLAIEPLASNFKLLTKNVSQNGYQHAQCLNVALGARDEVGTLSFDRETSHASLIHARPWQSPVQVRSLDSLCREHGVPHVDLLKIDTEGNELDVLAGAEETLAASPRARLLVEAHRGPDGANTAGPVRAWLAERGFSCRELTCDGKRFVLAAGPEAEEPFDAEPESLHCLTAQTATAGLPA